MLAVAAGATLSSTFGSFRGGQMCFSSNMVAVLLVKLPGGLIRWVPARCLGTVMNGVKGVYRRRDRHRRVTSPVSSAASVCSAPQATLMTL